MAAAKCSQCGFVGARGNEVCKRCGASLYQTHTSQLTAPNNRPKVIALSIGSAIVVLVAGVWFASLVFPTATPAPAEVAGLLYADSELNRPLTINLPTRLKQKLYGENMQEWQLLQSHVDVLAMQQLRVATIDSTKTKGDKPD